MPDNGIDRYAVSCAMHCAACAARIVACRDRAVRRAVKRATLLLDVLVVERDEARAALAKERAQRERGVRTLRELLANRERELAQARAALAQARKERGR